MKFYEQLDWRNWKQLHDEDKAFLFEQVLMYFVSPLVKIANVELIDFELSGVKCRTFELEINEEAFVFVPGNPEAIVGWDLGAQGIYNHELLSTTDSTYVPDTLAEVYDFNELASIDQYVNDYTSPLRKANIPPMIVQKYAVPAGTTYKGVFDTITGEYKGDIPFFEYFERAIKSVLFPYLTPEESLSWEQPQQYLRPEKFYFELIPETDSYYIFQHHASTYQEIKETIQKLGFDLLTPAQWEYAAGAGTRRIFRWGNELDLKDTFINRHLLKKITGPNMFGLVYPTNNQRYELTDNPECCKLEIQQPALYTIANILPLSSYYQGTHKAAQDEPLSPQLYMYRKSIRIEE